MKKILIAFTIILSVIFSGCSQTPAPNQQFRYTSVVFKNECEEDIYGVTFEYGLERQPMGGQAVSQDPEMSKPLKKGENSYIQFDERGFFDPESLNTSKFWIMVYVTLKNGKEIPIEYLYEWNAEYNQEYYFTLTGSSAKGFTFEPIENNNIDFTITPYNELPEDIFE